MDCQTYEERCRWSGCEKGELCAVNQSGEKDMDTEVESLPTQIRNRRENYTTFRRDVKKNSLIESGKTQTKSSSHPCFRRAGGIAQCKQFDLFDVDLVVETNEIPLLLLLLLWQYAGCASGCRGSTAGLRNRQCATGAHRHGTAVSARCCCGRQAKCS